MVEVYILHAGIGHPSPFFYNFNKELEKYKDIKIIVQPDLPTGRPKKNAVLYFHRLKRYYDSNKKDSINKFLEKVKELKVNGWKIIWTVHNFYPIDREINENDKYMIKEFIKLTDEVFTFLETMKDTIKRNYHREAIVHSFGFNKLDGWFDKKNINFDFPADAFVFSFVGNFSKYKNFELMIENFKKVKNEKTYLLIAGAASKFYKLDENLYKYGKNIIVKNGFVGETDWNVITRNSNIILNLYDLALPAFKEGFVPSNCLQILKHKKISISPKCREIEEIMPQGYVLEYDYFNEESLFKTMKYAIENKEKIRELELSFPQINYSWGNVAKIVVDKIRELF